MPLSVPEPWSQDPIDQPPLIKHDTGRAWRVNMATLFAAHPANPLIAQTTVLWLIEAPWANPNWHSYVMSLIALPWASHEAPTHEVVLFPLNPTFPRQALIDSAAVRVVQPARFAAHIWEDEPGQAVEKVRLSVAAICAGFLDPTLGAGVTWTALFGSNIVGVGASSLKMWGE